MEFCLTIVIKETMPNGPQWVIKRGENSLTLSHLNNIRFGCEDALMRMLKAKPKKKNLEFFLKLCWGNEIEPSKAKLLPTTKWRNNDDSDLPCEPKNHRVVSRDDENSKRLTFYPPFALAKDSSTLEKIQAKNSYKMCAKVTPDGQYQFGHFILQNSNRKYEFKSVF